MRYKKPDAKRIEGGFNPFANELLIPVRPNYMKRAYTIEGHTQDGFPILVELKDGSKYKDQDEYTKVFRSAVLRKRKAKLSPKASHLLMWMLDSIEHGKDYVIVNIRRYVAESQGLEYNANTNQKISSGKYDTVHRAIEELALGGVITQVINTEAYYINPKFFFKGSRVAKYPNNLVEVQSDKEKERKLDEAEADMWEEKVNNANKRRNDSSLLASN